MKKILKRIIAVAFCLCIVVGGFALSLNFKHALSNFINGDWGSESFY